jgi:hypothetical protein
MRYLLTYDLHKRRVYDSLYRLLAGWGAVRLTESLWMANLKGPADVVRDLMLAHLDADDTVAVVEIKPGSDWATMRVSAAANAWLSSNVTPSQKAA